MRPCRASALSLHVYGEADRLAPGRHHGGDGTCPSAGHHAQNPDSDHEPYQGVSQAVDLTHDPDRGFDSYRWARTVAARIRSGVENRVRYVISNYQITDGDGNWRPFHGDPHTGHMHVSWLHGNDDNLLPFLVAGPAPPPPPPEDDDMQMILDPLRDPLPDGRVPHFIVDHVQARVWCLNGARLVRDTPSSTGTRYWPVPHGAVPVIPGAAALRTFDAKGRPIEPSPQIVVAGVGGATWAVHIGKP